MSYRLNDQMTASLFIGGKEFVLDFGNAMQSVHLKASCLQALPVMRLSLVDTLNLMPEYGLQDGVQIVLQINGAVNMVRNFRVFQWTRDPQGQGFAYTIDCYWDSPKYWFGTNAAPIRGSSTQALQRIASMCGLGWDGNNTTAGDSMLWMQGNKTYANFAQDICRHGYVADNSHMALAVDSQGKLRYRDVNSITKPKVTVGSIAPPNASQFQMITDFQPHTRSGAFNALGGYRHSRYTQMIDGDSSVESQVTAVPDAQKLLVSDEVRGLMERGGISFSPLDWGNVHSNYERAQYQNARFNLLNSLTGEFLFPYATSWEPFDNFNMSSPAETLSSAYDGEYVVATKIVHIQGGTYNEKIIGVKNALGA